MNEAGQSNKSQQYNYPTFCIQVAAIILMLNLNLIPDLLKAY